jgi:hypothetical protein
LNFALPSARQKTLGKDGFADYFFTEPSAIGALSRVPGKHLAKRPIPVGGM